MSNALRLFCLGAVLGAVFCSSAAAATASSLTSPNDGSVVGQHPTLSWTLAPGEVAETLGVSEACDYPGWYAPCNQANPPSDQDFSFRTDLAPGATSYRFAGRLPAGRVLYWILVTRNASCEPDDDNCDQQAAREIGTNIALSSTLAAREFDQGVAVAAETGNGEPATCRGIGHGSYKCRAYFPDAEFSISGQVHPGSDDVDRIDFSVQGRRWQALVSRICDIFGAPLSRITGKTSLGINGSCLGYAS